VRDPVAAAVVDPAGRLTVDGVQEAAVGLLRRPDGTTQLTIAGWAVYRSAGTPPRA
jgi:hypothetical protein